MEEAQFHIADILIKHFNGAASEQEETLLNDWLNALPANRSFYGSLRDQQALGHKIDLYRSVDEEKGWQKILAAVPDLREAAPAPARVRRLRPVWWAAAAALLLVAGWYWWGRQAGPGPELAATEQADIRPGQNGAVLTLADGREVLLDSLGNGVVAVQNGSRVLMQDGRLSYDAPGAVDGPMQLNKVSTPRGRQFALVLPDGSRVWLNAESSISYPAAFAKGERKVEIKGEAYLEVMKDPSSPFVVNAGNRAEIKVLGTHFNVNAYDNEGEIAATLLEGSVAVSAGKSRVLLKPGEQAMLRSLQDGISVEKAGTNQVMAWKNGYFSLDGTSLETLMRQVERWYDIEVEYKGSVPNLELFGKISRDKTLQSFLTALKYYELKFSLEGRKLIISP